MQNLKKHKLAATLVVVAIVVLLLVASPELRPVLLLADSIGLDLLTLLLAMQLRHVAYALFPAANAAIGMLCALAGCIAVGAMRVYPKALPWRPFDQLFCPALVFVTYGIRCRVAARAPPIS